MRSEAGAAAAPAGHPAATPAEEDSFCDGVFDAAVPAELYEAPEEGVEGAESMPPPVPWEVGVLGMPCALFQTRRSSWLCANVHLSPYTHRCQKPASYRG